MGRIAGCNNPVNIMFISFFRAIECALCLDLFFLSYYFWFPSQPCTRLFRFVSRPSMYHPSEEK